MIKDLGDIMKQAQQMQEKMTDLQKDLASINVTGESGAGLVKVTMNGRHDVSNVEIDSSLFTEEKEMLEDLLAAAINDAVRRVEEANKDMVGKLTGGMQLPPGFKMPF